MLEHLYTALESPLGIILKSNNTTALRQKLYAERARVTDPALATLSFVTSPFDPTHLWIVKRVSDDG